MEWRCEWCGKPHAEDDPPCDNCGHGSFERAVVRQPASGPAGESTTVWVCTECGREHPKHAPPCSRCGNATLERREMTVDDAELAAPGYRDLLTPRYALGLAVALVLGTVLVLGLAGVVDLPGMDSGVPAVEDVPGSAEEVDGASLAAVESAYVDRLNERRTASGVATLSRNGHLDDVARYVNQRRVKALLGSGSLPSDDRMGELLGEACEQRVYPWAVRLSATDGGDTSDSLGAALATRHVAENGANQSVARGITGVDVHAGPDGQLYLTEFTC